MIVFKINDGVRLQTAKAKAKADKLTEKYKKPSVGKISGLNATKKYVKEEENINKLIIKYVELVDKDLKDILEMTTAVENYDALQKRKWNTVTSSKSSQSSSLSDGNGKGGGFSGNAGTFGGGGGAQRF